MADTRSKGTVKKWFDDKGYGFISTGSGKDLFVHISSFEKGLSRKPKVGDTVYFYEKVEKDGKKKAVDAVIEGVTTISKPKPQRKKTNQRNRNRKSGKFIYLLFVIVIAGGATIYDKFSSKAGFSTQSFSSKKSSTSSSSARFTCQGKTRCNQMTSCEEATFYINNCPGTKMDGDGDGIPCESQWCN